MNKLLCGFAVALLLTAFSADAREIGAIKKFVRPFPLPTYELTGQVSDKVISGVADASKVSVDGLWPDKKMLLISLEGKPGEGYLILYRAVEMNDQAAWDTRMRATGGPRCLEVAGGTARTITAGTNAFINPC